MSLHRNFLRGATAAGRISSTMKRTCVVTATSTPPHSRDTAGPQPMSLYGKERTELGSILSDVLSNMPSAPRYFLDNGTLLGLWRNGTLIDKVQLSFFVVFILVLVSREAPPTTVEVKPPVRTVSIRQQATSFMLTCGIDLC